MEVIVERPAALDVHKASVMAWCACRARWPARASTWRSFRRTVQGLLALARLAGRARADAGRDGGYRRLLEAGWALLEVRFDCMLVNARHVKQVPGRKTDVSDAQWLCRLLEAGLLRASLVPPKPIRTLRNLTRYRKTQYPRSPARGQPAAQADGGHRDQARLRRQRLLGQSGRAMLDALVSGTRDPDVLADLARGLLRKKLPALREALQGRFDAEHALVVGQILAHIDFLDAAIDALRTRSRRQIAPLAPAVELLCTIPGVERRAAEVIIAETGGDMTAFPPPRISPPGPACAPATTSPPASAAPAADPPGLEMAADR